jgi:hypothetical protein
MFFRGAFMISRIFFCLTIAAIAFISSNLHAQDLPVFIEQDGLVVFEVESHPPTGSWKKETRVKGYSGECYYTWSKSGITRTPGGDGLMTYKFKINKAGSYGFSWHNYHCAGSGRPHPQDDQTRENDSWTKIDDMQWCKTYHYYGSACSWNWNTWWDKSHCWAGGTRSKFNLDKGCHTLLVSGRSYGHSIDKIAIHMGSAPSVSTPESPREGDSPVSNSMFSSKSVKQVAGSALRIQENTLLISPVSDAKLNIVNASGRQIESRSLKGAGELSISLDSWSPGIYYASLDMGDGKPDVKRIVVALPRKRESMLLLN